MRYGLLGMQRLSQEWRMQKLRRLWSWRSLLRLSSSSQETQKRRDVAEDVKQSLPQIIKSEVVHFKPAQPHFYAQRDDVSVCGHSNQWNLEQSLPNFQLAIRSFQMPFYLSGPAPVLHENKQGVLLYAIAFCVEPGVLNLQETFLKTSFIAYFLFSPYILSIGTIRILLPRGRQTRK
mgnify:CR=1 FL=1